MTEPPKSEAGMAPADPRTRALQSFFDAYYAMHPVTATFAGRRDHDAALPDYSPEGRAARQADRGRLRRDLNEAGLGIVGPEELRRPDWLAIDGALADATVELEMAEEETHHFLAGNPMLAVADALYGVVALALRDGKPADATIESSIARLQAFPSFLHGARRSVGEGPMPAAWRDRTRRMCDGGVDLLADLAQWPVAGGAPVSLCRAFQEAASHAAAAVDWYRAWVAGRDEATSPRYAAGTGFLGAVIRRAHWCERPVEALRHEARASLEREVNRLNDLLQAPGVGSWHDVLSRMVADCAPSTDTIAACESAWREAATHSASQVSWPGVPVRFEPMPAWASRSALDLAWRLYRSPPPLDLPEADTYHVPLPDETADSRSRERFSRIWNRPTIRLLHVLQHGGLGRHALYWRSATAPSMVGRVAAVDGASRIAMPVGGSMVEGWAAYAVEMMEEVGYLSADERLAAQRERVHIMVRAVVDLELHTGWLPFEEAVRFHHELALVPEWAARAEVTRCSMFPGTGMMRWLGLRELWRLRHSEETRFGASFDPRLFHDAVLELGAIPVTLASRVLTESTVR